MGIRVCFDIEYPSNIGLVYNALFDAVVDIIKPTYIESPTEINHGDCFGYGLSQIMINLNQLKIENKGFDFNIWLDTREHENGLTGFDFDYFYKNGWYPEKFYKAVKRARLLNFLSRNGFIMTNELGDFLRFVSSHNEGQVIVDYIRQEIKPYMENIADIMEIPWFHIQYEINITPKGEKLFAICFDFGMLEDVD